MPTDETIRGLEYFKNIIESGKILKLKDSRAINQGYSYLMEIVAFSKGWHFSISRDNVNDLPGTRAFHAPALALARSLEYRFRNVDPNLFVTQSGRLLQIDIEWPPFPWVTTAGIAAASGVRISLTDIVTQERAHCAVQMTHFQTMSGGESDPFSRPAHIVNTVRSNVDAGNISFYPDATNLPKEMPTIGFRATAYGPATLTAQEYVSKKIWLLGFKAGGGKKETRAWFADPWDASYLGFSEADLRAAAAILDAQNRILLHEDGEFASVGKALLASEGTVLVAKKASAPTFRTPLDTYIVKQMIGEGGAGKVFRVVDDDGVEHALKHLKPESQSTHKTKRFKNELAFCIKNSHPNIISIEDWGLTEIRGIEVPFYIMPLFPETLRSMMAKTTDVDQLLQIFLQILDGVEAAHNAGVWHRDLKPENILYDPAINRVVVTDFGIAHFPEELQHTTIETKPSDRMANFRYAAPEQRSNGNVDQRADIYALGLILYELLTGELLQGTQHKKIGGIHPQLTSLDPVVEQMLRQSPDDRPSTIGSVRSAIGTQISKPVPESVHSAANLSTGVSQIRLKNAVNPAPVAYARYETTGPGAVRAETYVRPYVEKPGWFTYEDSFGASRHETEEQAERSFIETDRKLIREGYIRMNYANLSGGRSFNL